MDDDKRGIWQHLYPSHWNIMINRNLLLLVLSFLLLAGNGWGGTYYVDQTGGNDANSGTSQGNAWKTVSKVNRSSFSAGDSILFKRGETWIEQLVVPSSGNVGSPITFGAYGNGTLPILDTGTAKTGWSLATGKTNTYIITETAAYLSFFYERNGTTLVALIPKTSVAAVESTAGTWWLDAANDNLYVHTTDSSDPESNGKRYAAGSTKHTVDVNGKDYLTITNLYVSGGEHGIYIHGDSDYVTVDNCTMSGNRIAGVEGRTAATSNVIVQNSIVSYCGDGIISYATGDAMDTMLVTGNTISQINYGGEFPNEDGEGIGNQSVSNFTATNNTIRYVKQGIDVYAPNGATLSNIVVNRNSIAHTKVHGIRMEGDGTGVYSGAVVAYNIVDSSLDSALGAGIYLTRPGGGTSYAVNNDVFQYKNNIQAEATGSGWLVKNNISVNPVTYHVASASGMATDASWNNNLYYQASGTKHWQWNSGTDRTSFSTYQGDASPNEKLSSQANPLFVSSSDFRLQAGSPAINAGVEVGLTTDYAGNPVPKESGPDIGAYEFQGTGIIKIPNAPSSIRLY